MARWSTCNAGCSPRMSKASSTRARKGANRSWIAAAAALTLGELPRIWAASVSWSVVMAMAWVLSDFFARRGAAGFDRDGQRGAFWHLGQGHLPAIGQRENGRAHVL